MNSFSVAAVAFVLIGAVVLIGVYSFTVAAVVVFDGNILLINMSEFSLLKLHARVRTVKTSGSVSPKIVLVVASEAVLVALVVIAAAAIVAVATSYSLLVDSF